jgi:hypothetical protein
MVSVVCTKVPASTGRQSEQLQTPIPEIPTIGFPLSVSHIFESGLADKRSFYHYRTVYTSVGVDFPLCCFRHVRLKSRGHCGFSSRVKEMDRSTAAPDALGMPEIESEKLPIASTMAQAQPNNDNKKKTLPPIQHRRHHDHPYPTDFHRPASVCCFLGYTGLQL